MSAFEAEDVQRYEHETWSRCADQYIDGFGALTQAALPLVIEAAGVGEGRNILEIGSGPGHIAEALAQTGAKVTGIDFSASMVELAKRRYPHITFKEADAEQLPFDADALDAVVINFVVHHLARPEVAFKEVFRVLKTGGVLAFTVFASPEAQSSIGAFFQAVEAHHPQHELPHGPLFGVTDLSIYESMLTAASLSNLKFDFHKITWHSNTLDPVVASFWSWANMASLPPDVQGKIEETFRENLKPYAQEGAYAFPHEVLLGSATKP